MPIVSEGIEKFLFHGHLIVRTVYSTLLETSVVLVTFTGTVLSGKLPEIHLLSLPPSLLPSLPSVMVGNSDFCSHFPCLEGGILHI